MMLGIGTTTAQFKVETQLRPRFELRNGYQKLAEVGSVPTFLVSQRSRFSISYKTDLLRIKLVPQDVRIWGDEEIAGLSGVSGDYASLDMHEAYAEIRLLRSNSITVGRQELVYDNQSILSNSNWNQNGIAADAVVLKFRAIPRVKIDLGGIWNTQKESASNNYFPTDRIKTMGFAWLQFGIKGGWQVSGLHIASGITETDSTNALQFRQTSGIYTSFGRRYFQFSGNLYYQYGHNQAGTKVSAWMGETEASRRFGLFTPGIGLSYISGNSGNLATLATDHLFYELYRSRHLYNGNLDYFSNIASRTKQGGLTDLYAFLNMRLSGKLSLKNTGHYFLLSQTNSATPDKKGLGFENDLVLSYRFASYGILELGYLMMSPTQSLQQLQGVTPEKLSQFTYLQITLSPTLFEN